MEKWRNGNGGLWDLARAERKRSVWLATGFLAPAILTAACANTEYRDQHRFLPTGLTPQDVVTVILDKFSGEYSSSKEEEVAKCVSKAIGEVHPTVRLVSSEEFRRFAFPALTPTEPAGFQRWIDLAADAAFRARIASLGLRYLIIVEGSTNQSWKFEAVGGIGGGAAGFAGDRVSFYSASIVDVKRGAEVGRVDVRTRGRSGIVILPLPVPFAAPTEARACNELGEQVATFLVGDKPPAETAGR